MNLDKDWWRGSVTYQIYPRSFMDENGDGVGDLRGIISRLDYVAELGVDAIWLSPIFTSPMKDMGYDVSDYCDIDPVFGTLADFDALVSRAHSLGLKVIIDQVLSHSSDKHPLFLESRSSRDNAKADWYVWADPKPDGTVPNNWLPSFGGVSWEWEPRRGQYYLHNFLKEQPDFNFHNEEVQAYLLGTMRFWLDRGVDGFRLDVVNYYFHDRLLRDNAADFLPKDGAAARPLDLQYCLFSKNQPENLPFLQKMRGLLDEYDARALVGEIGERHHPIEVMGQYTSEQRLHMAYSFSMLGADFSPAHFRGQIERFFAGAPDGWPCWAFSNHDVVRHVTRWADHGDGAEALAKLAAALLLSFEGSICIYQGEELGLSETAMDFDELVDPKGISFWPADKGRDGCRTPMVWDKSAKNGGFSSAAKPWLPVKAPALAQAVNTQDGDESVLAFYRKLLRFRRSEPSLRTGRTHFLDTQENVIAFSRGNNLLCAFNLSRDTVRVDLPVAAIPLISQRAEIGDMSLVLGPNGFMYGRIASS